MKIRSILQTKLEPRGHNTITLAVSYLHRMGGGSTTEEEDDDALL